MIGNRTRILKAYIAVMEVDVLKDDGAEYYAQVRTNHIGRNATHVSEHVQTTDALIW